MFNAALYGPNAPYFPERQSLMQQAIAGRTSDIMCLVEVDLASDQTGIVSAAAKTTFPYAYGAGAGVTTNLSTPFTNPADQTGMTPPAPTKPPCDGVSSDLINAAIGCVEQNCSNQPPGDPTGELNGSTTCLEESCAAPIVGVQGATDPSGNPVGVACYDCLVVNIASDESFGATQSTCTTNAQAPLGFGGNENSLILSRYPLVNTAVLILPSTFYRRSVLYAQVQLEDQTVDFYCGFLMTTENASALPYVGNYGGGSTDSQTEWDNEQTYEAQQFVTWQAKTSNSNPAIVVGDWHSSLAVTTGMAPSGAFLPNELNAPTMNTFSSASWTFALATPPGSTWLPQCNDCPLGENPYNGAADQYFFSQPMLVNWPANSTTDESLFFTNGEVTLMGADAGTGPLSPYYGVNIRVIRPK
jgi:endonuclease/exonuclease/phosphatase family metal-dependent hydrolase